MSAYVSCLPAVCSVLNKKDSCTCARWRNGNAPRKGRRSFVPPTIAPDSLIETGKTVQTPRAHERLHTLERSGAGGSLLLVQLVHRDRSLTIGKAISRRWRGEGTRLITPCFSHGSLFRTFDFLYIYFYIFFLENYAVLQIRYRFFAISFSSTARNRMSINTDLVQHFFVRYMHFIDIQSTS